MIRGCFCFLQDLFLERLYERLDDTGLSENTYVVVVGDHGEVRYNKKYQVPGIGWFKNIK